jgi:hypothetical protein
VKRIRLFSAALFLLSPTLGVAQLTAGAECQKQYGVYTEAANASVAAINAAAAAMPSVIPLGSMFIPNPVQALCIATAGKVGTSLNSVGGGKFQAACSAATAGDTQVSAAGGSAAASNAAAASTLGTGGVAASASAQGAVASYGTCATEIAAVDGAIKEAGGTVASGCPAAVGSFDAAVAPAVAATKAVTAKCSADSAAAQGTAISASTIIGLGAALAGGAAIGFLVGRNNGKDSGGGGGGGSGTSSITPAPQPTISQCPPGQIAQGSLCVPAPAPSNATLGSGNTAERSAPSVNAGSGTEIVGGSSSGSGGGSGRPMAGNLSTGPSGTRSAALGQDSGSAGSSQASSGGGGDSGSGGGGSGNARNLASGSSSYNPAAGGAGGGGFGSESMGENGDQGSPPLAYMDMGRQPKVQIMHRGKRIWVNPLDGRVRPDCTKSVFAKHVRCRKAQKIASDPLLNKRSSGKRRPAAVQR